MVIKVQDWVGRKFGRLTVVGVERQPGFGSVLVCDCVCGRTISAKSGNLLKGSTASCGCLWREQITTHGMSGSRAYVSWKAMKSRCYAEGTNQYADYGGRGIKVCDRWLNSFENFIADMGEPPDGHTLDRIDNDGDYDIRNCRWATYEVQLNNTRRNVMLTAFGKTQSLTQWAREMSLPVTTLRNRLNRAKMSPEDALRAPLYAKQRGSP